MDHHKVRSLSRADHQDRMARRVYYRGGSLRTVPEHICEAEAISFEDAGVQPYLPCLLEEDHSGDHRSMCNVWCLSCGGVDLHYEDCPDPSETSDYDPRVMRIAFNDEGWYWCSEVIG